jgi:hypothetical protein
MPHDLKKLSCALVEYIRELDNSAFERIKGGAWITESIGTEEFCKRTPDEILMGLQARRSLWHGKRSWNTQNKPIWMISSHAVHMS